MKTWKNFKHQHAAHCESGTISTLLRNQGLELSEPMVFGLLNGLTFAFIPFLKLGNLPVTTYRMPPATMIKNLHKKLGIKIFRKIYRDENESMKDLDAFCAGNRQVGIQTSVYFITYFPPEMRFQFNAHNTIVVDKEGDEYIISDPNFETLQRIKEDDLRKARFARGLLAPKGMVWYPVEVPPSINFEKAIKKAIKKTWGMMLYAQVPIIGIKGINTLAKYLDKIHRKKDRKYVRQFLGNVVRMQEEIGTGGAGFRFIYAAFLQEAGEKLNSDLLKKASKMMTSVGDTWRQFALAAARGIKNKKDEIDMPAITSLLRKAAAEEKEVYLLLKKLK